MHSLNIVGVIVPPGAAHAARADMVGDHIVVVAEPFFAEGADAILGGNLAVEQLTHLGI